MDLVQEIIEIRSRDDFSANDVTLWVIKVFEEVYNITPSKEVRTEVYIHEGNVKGRADVVVQEGIGIETKSNLKNERQKAENQVYNILTKLENQGYSSPVGIATDGVNWSFYILINGDVHEYFDFELTKSSSNDEFIDRLWDGLTPLRQESDRPDPTAEKIAETFRPHGPVFNEIMSRFQGESEYVISTNNTDWISKFTPWFEIFSYVYNNFEERCRGLASETDGHEELVESLSTSDPFQNEDKEVVTGAVELYLRHTYLAVMAKTLASMVTLGEETVAERQLSDPTTVLTGQAAREHGVQISDPNDYFAWLRGSRFPGKVLESILKPLRRFSINYTDDVFRHVYEQVVDTETRHELGEFFTPKWITELMVEETIEKADEKVIDPACGSGTFLVFAIRRKIHLLQENNGEIDPGHVEKALNETWGIDINPLSTVLARTNLYLTLVSVVQPEQLPTEIEPQVVTADTFTHPRYVESQRQLLQEPDSEQSLIPVPISERITIPVLPKLEVNEAQEIIDHCGDFMEEGHDELPEEVQMEGERGEYQRAIFRTMVDLKNKYGDSLWKFVLRNYSIPPLISGEFDVVIGNPPWLSYREARSQIRQTMQQISDTYGINPPAHAKTSFNLAVPFFLTSANFLGGSDDQSGGVIAFVLPLSVLDSAAHTQFIEMLLSRGDLTIKSIYDLEEISPNPFPHTLPSAILTVQAESDAE